jgi:hypothetical protein
LINARFWRANPRKEMNLDNMNQAALNRHGDALNIQEGACNLSGVARALVRAINQCHGEKLDTQRVRDDAAIRFIVHQMAFLCNVGEIDRRPEVYDRLRTACEERDKARMAELKAVQEA